MLLCSQSAPPNNDSQNTLSSCAVSARSRMKFSKSASRADRSQPARSTAASIANRLKEPARQFSNSISLPPPDRLSRDQLSADPQRERARGNEPECGALISPASRNHRNVGKHRLQVPDVTVAPDVPAGHD